MPSEGSFSAAPPRAARVPRGLVLALAGSPLGAVGAMFFAFGIGLGLWSGASATILLRVGVGASAYGAALTLFTGAYLLAMSSAGASRPPFRRQARSSRRGAGDGPDPRPAARRRRRRRPLRRIDRLRIFRRNRRPDDERGGRAHRARPRPADPGAPARRGVGGGRGRRRRGRRLGGERDALGGEPRRRRRNGLRVRAGRLGGSRRALGQGGGGLGRARRAVVAHAGRRRAGDRRLDRLRERGDVLGGADPATRGAAIGGPCRTRRGVLRRLPGLAALQRRSAARARRRPRPHRRFARRRRGGLSRRRRARRLFRQRLRVRGHRLRHRRGCSLRLRARRVAAEAFPPRPAFPWRRSSARSRACPRRWSPARSPTPFRFPPLSRCSRGCSPWASPRRFSSFPRRRTRRGARQSPDPKRRLKS